MTPRAILIGFFLCLVFAATTPVENRAELLPARPETNPVPLLPDDIWFYDAQMKRVVPRVDPDWMTVVLSDRQATDTAAGEEAEARHRIAQLAEALVRDHADIIDWFHDDTLLENACFIRLRPGMRLSARRSLLADLNRYPDILYTHPAIEIQNRTYVFDNTLDLTWKTGVGEAVKERLLKQAHVSKDPVRSLYRVDIFTIPVFKAANLLAEDVHVTRASPHLKALTPPIRPEISFSIHGGNTGDKLPFVFSVHFLHRVRIDPSAIATLDLRPAGIQRELYDLYLEPFDAVRSVSASPIRITGWLQIYIPGEFVIPPVEIKYTCEACADKRVRTIRTQAIPLKIASIVPASWARSNLIVPEAIPPSTDETARYHKMARWNLRVATASFLITALSIGLVFRLRKSGKSEPEQSTKMGLETWSETLETALNRVSPAPGWRDAAHIGRIFRQYLAAACQAPHGQAGGSSAVFYEGIKAALPADTGPQILSLLTRFDDMVAEEGGHCPETDALISEVRGVLEAAAARHSPSISSAGSGASGDSREAPPERGAHA